MRYVSGGTAARRAFVAAAAVLLLACGSTGRELEAQAAADTTRPRATAVRRRTTAEDLQLFTQVLNQLRVNHPDSVDTHVLLMAAVEGMVRAADPHSFVIPAVRLDAEREAALHAGKLAPVPLAFRFIGGAPVVVSVAPGSRAATLDILPGDELVAIDGYPVRAESAAELEITLSGTKGTTIGLGFERRRLDGSLARLDRPVRREHVEDGSAVPAALMLDAETGYVRVTTFMNDDVASALHDALVRLEKQGMRRLLLDLRDNGGGRVDQAALIAGEFLPRGTVVYTTAGRKAEVADTGRVARSFWRSERRYPIVLLVNDGTASASELVAGALQDHDRALVVGRPTFGKALLMTGLPLSDGSAIQLVIGHVRTPCGRVIQRQYRTVTQRDYYRLARVDRDTVGRPSCRTDGGRVVYGGGGIFPDVLLDDAPPPPLWLARVWENDLVLAWVGGYVSANAARFTMPGALDTFARVLALPAPDVAAFRVYAGDKGVAIPAGAETDALLQQVLVRAVARAKFGDEGFYRVSAAVDPTVREAVRAFDRAAAILTAPQPTAP